MVVLTKANIIEAELMEEAEEEGNSEDEVEQKFKEKISEWKTKVIELYCVMLAFSFACGRHR